VADALNAVRIPVIDDHDEPGLVLAAQRVEGAEITVIRVMLERRRPMVREIVGHPLRGYKNPSDGHH
jgi:hypothetical protein